MKLNDKLIKLHSVNLGRPMVKFCGLRRVEDIEVANELAVDLVGFVFAKRSKRLVTPVQAKELGDKLSDDIIKVGVFLDEEPERIARLVGDGIIDVAQLHGSEDENYIREIKNRFNIYVVKAFGIGSGEDIIRANSSLADMVLLDNPRGGSGEVFDHSLLGGMDRPYFLAGGLDTENVSDIVKRYSPYGVDVSSGIETDGFKDPDKMRKFMELVRSSRSN